jgi:Flp pilus assembly protein TadD
MSAPVAGRGRRLLLAGAGLLLLAGAALLGWRWTRQPPLEPPMPAEVEAPEIREAITAARQEVLKAPASADAWGRLGMVLEAHLFEAEADRCFAEAARLDPDEPRWPYFRGLYALKFHTGDALPLLRRAAACPGAGGQGPLLRLRLAETLLERGELEEAEAEFREVWRRRPGDPRTAFGLGVTVLARGDRKAAAGFLETARGSPSVRKRATAQLAAVARAGGDFPRAAGLEKEAAALPPDPLAWPDPFVDQIVALQVGPRFRQEQLARLEQDGRYAEAAELYLKEVEERPSARAYVAAGLNLARIHEYDRAVKVLREAVRRSPDSPQAQFTLGLVLFNRAEKAWRERQGAPQAQQEFREAVVYLERATALKQDHARAYLICGLALHYLGDPAGAAAALRKGVDCRPGDIDLQLSLGEVLLDAGQLAQAETHLKNARQINDKDPRLKKALARLTEKQAAARPGAPPRGP